MADFFLPVIETVSLCWYAVRKNLVTWCHQGGGEFAIKHFWKFTTNEKSEYEASAFDGV